MTKKFLITSRCRYDYRFDAVVGRCILSVEEYSKRVYRTNTSNRIHMLEYHKDYNKTRKGRLESYARTHKKWTLIKKIDPYYRKKARDYDSEYRKKPSRKEYMRNYLRKYMREYYKKQKELKLGA